MLDFALASLAFAFVIFICWKAFSPSMHTVSDEALSAIKKSEYGQKVVDFPLGDVQFNHVKIDASTGKFSFDLEETGLCLDALELIAFNRLSDDLVVLPKQVRVGYYEVNRGEQIDPLEYQDACIADYENGKIPVDVFYELKALVTYQGSVTDRADAQAN